MFKKSLSSLYISKRVRHYVNRIPTNEIEKQGKQLFGSLMKVESELEL